MLTLIIRPKKKYHLSPDQTKKGTTKSIDFENENVYIQVKIRPDIEYSLSVVTTSVWMDRSEENRLWDSFVKGGIFELLAVERKGIFFVLSITIVAQI